MTNTSGVPFPRKSGCRKCIERKPCTCLRPLLVIVEIPCRMIRERCTLMKNPHPLAEAARHRHFMELLADETHQPVSQIEPLYELVLEQLKGQASIPDFVPVFAWRRTRALLQHR